MKFVEAEYPAAEKDAGTEAHVVLTLGISEAGAVIAVVVQETAGPAFDAAAVAAARQFLFEPAEVNGKRIPVKITYRYDFVVKQEVIKRTKSDFEGTVRDRGTKKPIPGVKIKLETCQEATTDAQGHFLIPAVESGDHTVTLSGEGLTQVGTKETFEGGKKLDATYDVELKASVRRLRHRRCRPCSRQRRRLRRSRRPSRTSSTLPPSGARSRRRQANVAEPRSPVPRCLGD